MQIEHEIGFDDSPILIVSTLTKYIHEIEGRYFGPMEDCHESEEAELEFDVADPTGALTPDELCKMMTEDENRAIENKFLGLLK